MWRRGPLFSEHRRQRSVNAVKLRSSGSVIAKHLMRRSRRQELSMYTAVVVGWRETSTHVAGSRGGVAPPLRSGGTGACTPGAPPSPCPPCPLAPSSPRPSPARPPPRALRGGSDAPENACQFSRLQLPIVRIDYGVLICIDVVMKRKENLDITSLRWTATTFVVM